MAPGAEYTAAVASEPDTKPIDEPEDDGEAEEERLDPEREARKLVALAQIRQYPDPVLRMRARRSSRSTTSSTSSFSV